MAKTNKKAESVPCAIDSDREWKIKNALSTLQEAEKIKADKPLMEDVRKAAADLQKVLDATPKDDFKKKAKEVFKKHEM